MNLELISNPTVLIPLAVIAVWLIIITILLIRSERRFIKLIQGISKRDLRSILEGMQKHNQLTLKEIGLVKKTLKQTQSAAQLHFQNLGFIRYNPFSDTGGDQSFCLSLLDGHRNGVVISSLHSRDQTRIYAKKIENGKSPGHTLSKEERAVIKQASTI